MSLKRKSNTETFSQLTVDNGTDLFVDEPADDSESDLDNDDTTDSSDSDSSVYSGLGEDEEDSSDSDEEIDEGSDLEGSNLESSDLEGSDLENESDEEGRKTGKEKTHKDLSNDLVNKKNNTKTKNKSQKLQKPVKETKIEVDQEIKVKDKEEEDNVKETDEYKEDSSDEEDIRNTVGNIPMEWYKNYKHIGYDVEGRKLVKPQQGDQLDEFLDKADDPNYWRTVHNKLTGQKIVLSKEDIQLIQNIQKKQHPTESTDEQYQAWVDWFSSEVMIHPLSNQPEHKRSFIPSKWERLKVGQMVHALKMGWMKPSKTDEEKDKEEEEEDEPNFYMIWKDEDETEISKRYRQHIPAPKLSLPGHAESYNPPPEYIFTKEEAEKWKEQEPEERRINFMPKKFSSLRSVPSYRRFINERFERCLDLYLCPRQRKVRMNVDPEDLIPKLPKPKDLQPFPTTQSIIYKGHTGLVRSISVDPSGQWLVSGSDDGTIKIWEVASGRCMKTLHVEGRISSLTWNPNPAVCLVACAIDKTVMIFNPGMGDKLQLSNTDNMLNSYIKQEETQDSRVPVSWSVYEGKEYDDGYRLKLPHGFEVSQVTWHGKGDYFATVMPNGQSKSVLIHQLSRRRSQNPFSKSKGIVQCVRFHPVRPFLFVATQRYIRVYNLLKQEMSKKLVTNCKWVSSMAVHPEGDNVIIGGYDSRMSWFDLDLSTKPYQTLKHHKKAIRQVCYHKRYPLFASASDDCSVIVCHGMVYNDLLQNPLIVPVKVLRGHTSEKDVGILDCVFHPLQPWIFSAGADATIRLYT
ncbi:ribosome biogenesis protein bop1-B-like [Ruditapes philippinarum]|uniref:ribosome biogenesis protein bop1-B-like n=1 Tax=Ruditapes philippinarum TaxID=129788 RepID=UPI00295A5C98|nr:ribosome biogenesis protein bop1-B-like [Ruditapes philippinarum]